MHSLLHVLDYIHFDKPPAQTMSHWLQPALPRPLCLECTHMLTLGGLGACMLISLGPLQNVRQMVDTNVTAVAILTKLFAAGMVERNRGHIINISSVAAHHAYPGVT